METDTPRCDSAFFVKDHDHGDNDEDKSIMEKKSRERKVAVAPIADDLLALCSLRRMVSDH